MPISMFNSKEHSDLEIHCKDGTLIYAHKAIVCPKSKFFANACKPGHFKVRGWMFALGRQA